MRSGLLAVGILLFVFGGLIYMVGSNGVSEYQTSLGQVNRYLSQSAQQDYQRYMLMETGGGLFAIVGLIISLAGIVSSEKGSSGRVNSGERVKRKVLAKKGAKTVTCPICGCSLDIATKTEGICPDCKNIIEILYEG
jgi:hypothetical protein